MARRTQSKGLQAARAARQKAAAAAAPLGEPGFILADRDGQEIGRFHSVDDAKREGLALGVRPGATIQSATVPAQLWRLAAPGNGPAAWR